MYFAIDTPNFGDYSDPRLLAELAREAENAGWDGFFLWDHIGSDWSFPVADPWVALSAMAMTTERIKLGPLVTPIPRRRPWKLAREAVTLDHLSNGRLILGVGIGMDSEREYSCFGEATDDKLHGSMLDEGLDVLMGLWSGEPFSYKGEHYQIHQARFLPKPVQVPRIPIWVAGAWPNKRPFRRAALWDGVVPMSVSVEHTLTPDEIRTMVAYIQRHRQNTKNFDVIMFDAQGFEKNQIAERLFPYAEAGVTWWLDCSCWSQSLAGMRKHILQGPPPF